MLPSVFKSAYTNKIFRKMTIRGGRSFCGKKLFKRNDNDAIEAHIKNLGYKNYAEFMQEIVNYNVRLEKTYYHSEERLETGYETYYKKCFERDFPELHAYFKELNMDDCLVDLDATSLYPSAMVDPRFIWPDIKSAILL